MVAAAEADPCIVSLHHPGMHQRDTAHHRERAAAAEGGGALAAAPSLPAGPEMEATPGHLRPVTWCPWWSSSISSTAFTWRTRLGRFGLRDHEKVPESYSRPFGGLLTALQRTIIEEPYTLCA